MVKQLGFTQTVCFVSEGNTNYIPNRRATVRRQMDRPLALNLLVIW